MLLFWMRTAKLRDFLNINVFQSSFVAFCAFILTLLDCLFVSDTFSNVLFWTKINEIESITWYSIDPMTFSRNECFLSRWVRRIQRSHSVERKLFCIIFFCARKFPSLNMYFTTVPGKLRHYKEFNKHQMFAMRWNWAIKWLKCGEKKNKYTCVYYYIHDFRWDFPSKFSCFAQLSLWSNHC